MTVAAAVRELKNRITHYLRLVRRGERVIVTDRGRPIAVLRPIEESDADSESLSERLASLAREGGLRLGEPNRRLGDWRAAPSKGEPASQIVSRDRDRR